MYAYLPLFTTESNCVQELVPEVGSSKSLNCHHPEKLTCDAKKAKGDLLNW